VGVTTTTQHSLLWYLREKIVPHSNKDIFMPTEPNRSKVEAPSIVDPATTPIEQPEDGIFTEYANVVNLDWTLYDVRIRFGELMQVLDDNSPTWNNQHGIILEKAAIRIPWHQAKFLCLLLAGVIKNYEELNGELKTIKLPAAPT
jgi:hypothetical protein